MMGSSQTPQIVENSIAVSAVVPRLSNTSSSAEQELLGIQQFRAVITIISFPVVHIQHRRKLARLHLNQVRSLLLKVLQRLRL